MARGWSIALTGNTAITSKGEFEAYMLIDPGLTGDPLRSLMQSCRKGLVACAVRPVDKKIRDDLIAQKQALEATGADPIVVRQYEEAIREADAGHLFLESFSLLAQLAEGYQLPQGSERFPIFPTIPNLLDPPRQRVYATSRLDHLAAIPSHTGGEGMVLDLGLSLDNMKIRVSMGDEQQARHIAILGPTRRGKSTTAKYLLAQALEKYPDVQFIIADLKGEYTRSGENGSEEPLFPHSCVLRPEDLYPLGYRTLRAQTLEEAMKFAGSEEYVFNLILKLSLPGRQVSLKATLVDLWKQTKDLPWEKASEGIARLRHMLLEKLGVPKGHIVETILRGRARISPRGGNILSLSHMPYGSPEQQAALNWGLFCIVPFVRHYGRRVVLIEEFQLVDGAILSVLLRVAGGLGVSVVAVTQAQEQLDFLAGAGKQFASAVLMSPTTGGVIDLAKRVFDLSITPGTGLFTRRAEADIQTLLGMAPYGAFASVSSNYGVQVGRVFVPPDLLRRIEEFNLPEERNALESPW